MSSSPPGVPTPHDRLFKEVFSQPSNAVSELRYLLPPEVVSQLDWSTLKVEPGEYIDQGLRFRQSDLLFSVRMRAESSRSVLVHVLFEHQSRAPETFFPLRLLVYMVRILEQYVTTHPDAKHLPVVVPVVLYHGEGKWHLSEQFTSLYAPSVLSSSLSKYIPQFEYVLDNLHSTEDETLRARDVRAHVKSALWFLKRAREGKRILEEFGSWVEVYRAMLSERGGADEFLTLMRYYVSVSRAKLERVQARVGECLGPQTEEMIMTLAEELRQEGEQRSKSKWKAEGKAEGEARALYTMLHARGLQVDAPNRERIERCRDVSELDRWVRKAAVAQTVEEVFS